ncbi:MAG: ABC transporter substrate-binding protein [Sandaracinaceae bacterium]
MTGLLDGWRTMGGSELRIVAVAAVGVLFCACAPEQTLVAGELDPVRIGVVTSLTGGLGTDGPGWADASRLAALEVNAAGGVLPGRPIELVILDDETNPATAERIGQELIDQNVVGVVGAAASSISIGISAITGPAQIPQISCCSTSNTITENARAMPEADRYFFRTSPSDALQSRVVALTANELSCTSLAILHLDDDYGQPFGEGIESAYEASGGTVAVRVGFADEQASYVDEVAMIRDAGPDCIALVAFPGAAGTILRDWESLGETPDVTWIGTDGVRALGFIDEVGDPRLIEGFFGTSPITDAPTPEYNDYRDHFRTVFGTEPIPFSSNQYDATVLLALAIAHAGSTSGPAVRDALRIVSSPPSDRGIVRAGAIAEALAEVNEGRDVDYQGASGNTDFDEFHDVQTAYEIWRYDGPDTTPCDGATALSGDRGSFCRFRTINAAEID